MTATAERMFTARDKHQKPSVKSAISVSVIPKIVAGEPWLRNITARTKRLWLEVAIANT